MLLQGGVSCLIVRSKMGCSVWGGLGEWGSTAPGPLLDQDRFLSRRPNPWTGILIYDQPGGVPLDLMAHSVLKGLPHCIMFPVI